MDNKMPRMYTMHVHAIYGGVVRHLYSLPLKVLGLRGRQAPNSDSPTHTENPRVRVEPPCKNPATTQVMTYHMML